MGFSSFLKDLFASKKIERSFRDPRIGALKASVSGERPDAWCSWEGAQVLAGQTTETWFCLSGDSRGPYSGLLAQTHRVLDALGAIGDKANALLRACGDSGSFGDFYLARIGDWDQHDEILELEFMPREGATLVACDRTVYWPDEDEFTNHHVVLRVRDWRRSV